MPVYLRFSERDVGLTDEDARLLAGELAGGPLRDQITARAGADLEPLSVDVGGDEARNLIALYNALSSLESRGELNLALTRMRDEVVAGFGEGDWDVAVWHTGGAEHTFTVHTYIGALPAVGEVIELTSDEGEQIKAQVTRLTPGERHTQVRANELPV